LLDATHAASSILSNSEIRDIEDITSNVFEEGAEIITKHVLEILNAN
jgi:predicted ThiF/HesA family dinucleotide-utilizing enzyme